RERQTGHRRPGADLMNLLRGKTQLSPGAKNTPATSWLVHVSLCSGKKHADTSPWPCRMQSALQPSNPAGNGAEALSYRFGEENLGAVAKAPRPPFLGWKARLRLRRGGGEAHFRRERREPPHDLVHAHRHAVDDLDLGADLWRQRLAHQQEFGIPEHRRKRVVHVVTHLQHVAPHR